MYRFSVDREDFSEGVSVDVVVIGGSGTFPRAGGACNGFLVRHQGTNILLDLGTGVLSRLYKWLPPDRLDALIITHLHPDHFLDIYPYRYYLEFCAPKRLPLPVFAPAGAADYIRPLFNESEPEKFNRVFTFADLAKGPFTIGPLEVAGHKVVHLEPTYGISVIAAEKRIFYTSDTDFDPCLIEYARGADLLMAETTFLAGQEDLPVPHMTTAEVAEVAVQSGAARLLLTHIWPHYDRGRILAEVEERFDGRINLADEDLVIEL